MSIIINKILIFQIGNSFLTFDLLYFTSVLIYFLHKYYKMTDPLRKHIDKLKIMAESAKR